MLRMIAVKCAKVAFPIEYYRDPVRLRKHVASLLLAVAVRAM